MLFMLELYSVYWIWLWIYFCYTISCFIVNHFPRSLGNIFCFVSNCCLLIILCIKCDLSHRELDVDGLTGVGAVFLASHSKVKLFVSYKFVCVAIPFFTVICFWCSGHAFFIVYNLIFVELIMTLWQMICLTGGE